MTSSRKLKFEFEHDSFFSKGRPSFREKACLHENEVKHNIQRSFTNTESTITFDLEVELKQNFQDLSFMTNFKSICTDRFFGKSKDTPNSILDSFGKGL